MKTKSLLFNPFTRLAGGKALAIGLIIMAIVAVIGAYSQVYFDGALDIHAKPLSDLPAALIFMATGYVALVVVFYIMGLIFSKKVRFIDIAGTVALSRFPYLLAALAGFLINDTMRAVEQGLIPANSISKSVSFPFLTVIVLVVIIWHIALLYNAYRESTGLKNTKGTITFIAGVLLAETFGVFLLLKVVGPYLLS